MRVEITDLFFLFGCFYIVFLGILVNWFRKYVPTIITDTFLFGKYSSSNRSLGIKVPKRWFRHFYVFSVIFMAFFCIPMVLYYLQIIQSIPQIHHDFLSFHQSEKFNTKVVPANAIIAIALFSMQVLRRFYETHYVCVYSDLTIDISHYIVGILHYYFFIVVIMFNAPVFNSDRTQSTIRFEDISICTLIASSVFMWAWWNQYLSGQTLANLRKNSKGEAISTDHKIPHGGLFNYVSSPLNLCEILMYICLMVILYECPRIYAPSFWVFINQVETAILAQRWYKEKFKNYPKNRKIVIPFIF